MHKILAHPSITQRAFAFDDPSCLLHEDPDSRMERFRLRAIELSSEAVLRALKEAGLTSASVAGLVVNTCTGYVCPGISTYLIEKLNLSQRIPVYDLVGSGCGGAIPNLQIAGAQIARNKNSIVSSVSVEICSATFHMEDDLSLIVSNALFADGAAAAVLWDRQEGFELVDSSTLYVPEHRDDIRYIHKNGQLYNSISTYLPHVVKKAVSQVVADLLKPRSLGIRDIKHWALHTGGEKIINEIKKELGLSETQPPSDTRHSIAVRQYVFPYGLVCAPSYPRFRNRKRGLVLMVAFGAGLSAHACLLRKSQLPPTLSVACITARLRTMSFALPVYKDVFSCP